MVIVGVSIIPVGTQTPSLSRYITQAVTVLEAEEDLKYELTAMGTLFEGNLPRLMGIMEKMHEAAFTAGVARLVTTVKIDDWRDKASSMVSKVESLKSELAH